MFKNKFQIKNKTQSLTDRGNSRKTGHLSFWNWSKGIFSFTNQTFTGVGPCSSLIYQVDNTCQQIPAISIAKFNMAECHIKHQGRR